MLKTKKQNRQSQTRPGQVRQDKTRQYPDEKVSSSSLEKYITSCIIRKITFM